MVDLKRAGILMKQGQAPAVVAAIGRRLYSDSLALGLRRDLARSFKAPQAKIPLTVRPLVDADHRTLRTACNASTSASDANELFARLRLLKAGITTCYAAVDARDAICYVQWLMKSDDNDTIQKYFCGAVPRLEPDEALIEGAYAFSQFRGLGVMACAMAQIAEKASDFGARWVITLVGKDNVASLKGCKSAGFEPFLVRKEHRRLLRRRFVFEQTPAD